jgi:hypothetical protein
MPKKQPTTIIIEGLSMTEQRQAQVGQALKIALAHQLDGEIDDMTIAFATRELR